MKRIIKKTSPQWFENWKKQHPRRFEDDIVDTKKRKLRKQLVEEQGYICCYCGREIDTTKSTTIEHFLPKDDHLYPHYQLEYNNLFASCDGFQKERKEANSKGEAGKELYPPCCDSLKNNEEIPICPTDEDCETHFEYFQNGLVSHITENGKDTIEKLGLNNNSNLVKLRRAAIEGKLFNKVIVGNKVFNRPKSNKELKEEIANVLSKSDQGKFIPFCFAIKDVAEKMIAFKEVK